MGKETQAQKFNKWITKRFPNVRPTSTGRGYGNHQKGNAVDLAGIRFLSKEDKELVFTTAISMGLRVGDETKGVKGVKGWTGPHYHFDGEKRKSEFVKKKPVHFTRGGETGLANYTKKGKKGRNSSENKINVEHVNDMLNIGDDLKKQGPTEGIRETQSIADLRQIDDSDTITSRLDSFRTNTLAKEAAKSKISFDSIMAGLKDNKIEQPRREIEDVIEGIANVEPEDRFTGNNIRAILDNKPQDYIPQIKKNTPILADNSAPSLPTQESQEITLSGGEGLMDVSTETTKPVLEDKPEIQLEGFATPDFGGKEPEASSVFMDLKEFTLEGMGDDLTNNFIDRNAVGFLTQNAIKAIETNDKFDPKYDAKKDELYTELTQGLDSEDLEEVLSNSWNRHDFIVSASLVNARNKRVEDMQKYSSEHPVLSGVNTVGNIFAEGAVFMPVSSIAAAGLGATRIKKVNDLYKMGRVAKYAAGELIEQGLQEVIWSRNQKDYEFDPLLFATGIGVGVGLKTIAGSAEADAAFRNFLKDEKGFINIATGEGKKLVDEVTSEMAGHKAVELAEMISKKKVFTANSLRKEMMAKGKAMSKKLTKLNTQIASAKKGTKIFKKLKGQKQKLVRKIEKFDKSLPNELEMLATGTHPKLTAAVDPQFKLSNMAEELDIDPNLVNTTKKARQFLGLDNVKTDPDFVFEGEKMYESVARKQLIEMADNMRLNANESLRYAAGTDTVKAIDKLPLIGRMQIADKLNYMAETDGPISRMLFNKGNLVSSKNPLTGSFYNWMAGDGMGRQGMSKMRAMGSQQRYAGIYGGDLMDFYHTHGDKLYTVIEGDGIAKKAKSIFNADSYEDTIEPIFKNRVEAGADAEGFRIKYGDELANIADDFYADFNTLNMKINKRAKEVGVEGYDFDGTEGWFHRSWDFRKARTVPEKDLSDTIYRAMRSHMDKLGIKDVDEKVIREHASKFAYGLRNADLSAHEALDTDHIKLLGKLVNKVEGKGVEATVVRSHLSDLKMLKAKAEAGDLANRVQMDTDVLLPDGRKLSDLFEDNLIHTQKKYTARMSARIAAAEHGIKNIDTLDEWIQNAVELEIKSLAKKGVKNPANKIKHMRDSMKQDLSSFKHGGMASLDGLSDDTAESALRMLKKFNFAKLMQYNGISSMTELGKTIVDAGVANTLGELSRHMRQSINDLYMDNPNRFVGTLYDELRSVTGVGMEDYAFSTKGMSKASRITDEGTAFNKIEKGLDVLGRLAQLPFGQIETTMRRVTVNALAIKWANHFTGKEKGGLLSAFFGSNGTSNRVLENSGFGTIVDNKFISNPVYRKIQRELSTKAKFKDGRLIQLNLKDWDVEAANKFGDAIEMQAHHIMVTPDATTMSLFQSTPIGQVLYQFQSFTINATTKVMGATVANAAISSARGDQAEMIKAAQTIFWGTAIGTMSVALRQGIQRAGGDKEIDLFDEGLIKAAGIGFARSSVAGNIPSIIDSVSGAFGVDPIFEKTSSMGRSKSFFNIGTTPTGQAFSGVYKSGTTALQGDFKGAGMKLLKASPIYRQIGLQQIFNFVDDEK